MNQLQNKREKRLWKQHFALKKIVKILEYVLPVVIPSIVTMLVYSLLNYLIK